MTGARGWRTARHVVIAVVVLARADAAIAWDRTMITHVAAPDATEAVVSFPFVNQGPQAVTITGLNAACGCTTPQLDQRRYEAGEGGEVTVVFAFGERTGPQRKSITVTTDDAANPRYRLTLAVDIPRLLSVDKPLAVWAVGAEPVDKDLVLTIGEGFAVTSVVVEPDQGVVAAVREVEAGRRYVIALHPLSTATETVRRVRIVTDHPIAARNSLTVFASVR